MSNNKKTLVIHPEDPTTSFLDDVYKHTDWTIVNDNMKSKSSLCDLIKSHDRIFMMGHGTPYGLIGKDRLIIDSTFVYLLREKEIVCMWCNADLFVKKYGLKGFHTGMIISEEVEAIYCGVEYKAGDVDESNVLFTRALKESIDNTGEEICKKMKEIYIPSPDNKVMDYNSKRLYFL